jgi:hypothetical protein
MRSAFAPLGLAQLLTVFVAVLVIAWVYRRPEG